MKEIKDFATSVKKVGKSNEERFNGNRSIFLWVIQSKFNVCKWRMKNSLKGFLLKFGYFTKTASGNSFFVHFALWPSKKIIRRSKNNDMFHSGSRILPELLFYDNVQLLIINQNIFKIEFRLLIVYQNWQWSQAWNQMNKRGLSYKTMTWNAATGYLFHEYFLSA